MSVDSKFQKACLSCLLHDLRVAKSCLGHHARNAYNPYSLHFSSELSSVFEAVSALYRKVDELGSIMWCKTYCDSSLSDKTLDF